MRGGAGVGRTCRCTDTRTWECSLNVSVTCRCRDASCRDVVPTFESAGQRKMEERKRGGIKRGMGLMRKKGRRNSRMDKESLKGLTNSSRGQKSRLKDELKNGRTFALSLVLWSSLCTYRLSQPSVAALCSLFSPSLKKKIFLFSKFVLFYYLKTVVVIMMLSMKMSILLIL